MKILGIETSCDETSAAILEVRNNDFNLLSHLIFSQIDTHKEFGGVVPEVAARLHVQKIIPIIKQTFKQANLKPSQIDAIAVTAGPGLVTALIPGIHTARCLSYLLKKPLVAVNHMEGHIAAHILTHKKIEFPALCLTVSGGHTELVLIKKWGEYKIIGQTRDDAAGEAFDKTAKILGLSYPGGPIISKLAKKAKKPFELPSPMLHSKNYDFSFSGLKTAVLYTVRDIKKLTPSKINNIAAGIEQAISKVLTLKTVKAAKEFKVKTVMIAGGVAANTYLREDLKTSLPNDITYLVPDFKFCTDNAAMIAAAAYFNIKRKQYSKIDEIKANPVWRIDQVK